jgi:adenylate cyclase class IV
MKVGLKKVTIYSLYDLDLLIDDIKNVCNIDDIEIIKENNNDIVKIYR